MYNPALYKIMSCKSILIDRTTLECDENKLLSSVIVCVIIYKKKKENLSGDDVQFGKR